MIRFELILSDIFSKTDIRRHPWGIIGTGMVLGAAVLAVVQTGRHWFWMTSHIHDI